MDRRGFLEMGGMLAGAGLLGRPAGGSPADGRHQEPRPVNFEVDGLGLSPQEYSLELSTLAAEDRITPDYYSLGGTITELEQRFASLLTKESAIFVPTGTMANHIAVRSLAGNDRRVLVQAESHMYNDCGDCAALLSGLTLVPLAPAQATFTLAQVEQAVERTAGGRVEARIGVISIESPVRRRDHEVFDFDEMTRIAAYARQQAIRLHLDGARLFNQPFHCGKTIAQYTSLFDTVYVSLWKCFNAASGAILAGARHHIDGLFHLRRMLGGSLPQAWPDVAVALRYADGYLDEYARAWSTASQLFSALEKDDRFGVEKVANGTSAFRLRVRGVDPDTFAQRLRQQGVMLPHVDKITGTFRMIVNTSLNRTTAERLMQAFSIAARG